jgi:copper chaperone NosL
LKAAARGRQVLLLEPGNRKKGGIINLYGENSMKRLVIFVLAVVFLIGGATIFTNISITPAFAGDDIAAHPACPYCGMDRQKFAHSRIYIEFDDGSTLGTCSLHCAAVDLAVHIDKAPVKITVGDYDSKQLIDAETAFWVIGGDKMGVMTARAKWAFATKEAAEAYIQAHGGTMAGFEEAIEAAYADMYKDTRMIREKRKMKRQMKKS